MHVPVSVGVSTIARVALWPHSPLNALSSTCTTRCDLYTTVLVHQ
jgi:hypothetical protein